MIIPMLNEDEFALASKLYSDAFKQRGMSIEERFAPLLEYYEEVTGFHETVTNAIMHHRISQYGPDCEKCGKPYRTPESKVCAACGNKKIDM